MNFRELSRCLALDTLIARALKVRGGNQEYLNSMATAERYAKMIEGMKTLEDLKRVFIELVAVGRESMQDGPRAAIASIVNDAIEKFNWTCFSGGTFLSLSKFTLSMLLRPY